MRRTRRVFAVVLAALGFAATASAQAPRPTVRALSVSGGERRAVVVVAGDFDVPRYAVRSRDGGRAVVLEVDGARFADDGLAAEGQAGLVANTTSAATARGVRLEIGLRAPVAHGWSSSCRAPPSSARRPRRAGRPGAGSAGFGWPSGSPASSRSTAATRWW